MTSMEINLEELLRMLSHMCKRSFYQKKTYYCNIFLTSSKKMFWVMNEKLTANNLWLKYNNYIN